MPKQKTKRAPRQKRTVPYNSPPPAPSSSALIDSDLHGTPVSTAPFILNEDGTIQLTEPPSKRSSAAPATPTTDSAAIPPSPPRLVYRNDDRGIWLYHGNSLELLDAIAAKYPEGRFDAIFADPPYFLSNGGITCHAGKMVRVDKGDWDKSRGPELNHEFNLSWLRRCQRVLKPNGTIWVSGTHHVIFSIGYAMQQLGYKILNDIAWEKPNPPPNLSCRYFTHSTETILWAAKNEKSKHTFNYQAMRRVTGKQMKTVWRKEEFQQNPADLHPVWTLSAPGPDEKEFGKHPTQKPIALVERCLLASTNEGDIILDPFLGGGTTAVTSFNLRRAFVGCELERSPAQLATRRVDCIDSHVFGAFAIRRTIFCFSKIDLDPKSGSMDRIRKMHLPPEPNDQVFHESKFVFLSSSSLALGDVVYTVIENSLESAWNNAPERAKSETTHIVICRTDIIRIKA